MPRFCAVVGCKSNHKSQPTKVPVFQFPFEADKKLQWVNAIGRQNWQPSKNSVVCGKHFTDDDFARKPNEPFERLQLYDSAVPSVFDSKRIPIQYIIATQEMDSNATQPDYIGNFEIFCRQYKTRLDFSKYLLYESAEKMVFYKLQGSDDLGCDISTRICISNKLYVKVIIQNTEVFSADLELLPRNMKVSKWSQIAYLLNKYRDVSGDVVENRDYLLNRALHYLVKVRESDFDDFQHCGKLDILINQIELLNKTKPRYAPETISFAFMIFAHSVATYNILRKFLIIPHTSYLRCVSADVQINSDNNTVVVNDEHGTHREPKLVVSDKDKYVILLIDEIRIEDSLEYKINEHDCNNLKQFSKGVRTLVIFTIKSIFGTHKKIIRIFPILRPTADIFYDLTRAMIKVVQALDFKVVVINIGNNEITSKMFHKFCGTTNMFVNPDFPNLKIYVQYDIINLLKSVRDDWMKLKNMNKTFVYPDFEDYSIKQASFDNFELLHNSKCTAPGAHAYKLDRKTLTPNIYERHNLTLVQNLFHESTITALQHHDKMKETADFCIIIKKWWEIVNSKETPIKSITDERFVFLENFITWLNIWNSSANNSGSLTKPTIDGLKLTTQTFIDLIKFSFSHCKVDCILLGKLQTDDLIGRYSLYQP